MNVKLLYDIEFLAGIYYQDQLQLNQYSVRANLLTQTDSASTTVAMERLKCFVYKELVNTVFFGPEDRDKAEMFQVLGMNVTTLPDMPVDQIIGLMLFCKLNAVMEGRMILTELDICSTLGDSVWYCIEEDDNFGPFADTTELPWWHNSSTQHHNLNLDETADNVVKVIPSDWHQYELQWPEECIETNNTVIYPDFRRNETKQTQ